MAPAFRPTRPAAQHLDASGSSARARRDVGGDGVWLAHSVQKGTAQPNVTGAGTLIGAVLEVRGEAGPDPVRALIPEKPTW